MTIPEFFNACQGHDWYYNAIDDHREWLARDEWADKLIAEAATDPVKQAIYDAWYKHHFTGEPWKNEKAPTPTRAQFGIPDPPPLPPLVPSPRRVAFRPE